MSVPPYQTVLEEFPDHAKAIGIASIEVANLDIFLGYMFAAILKIPAPVGEALFLTPNSAFARLELLKTAINEMMIDKSPGQNQLMTLYNRAANIVTKRNSMIHDSWGTNAAGEVARRDIRALAPMTPVPL
jgi:hypothetical protein